MSPNTRFEGFQLRWLNITGSDFAFPILITLFSKQLNSQGTENFPFSYFANPKLKLIKVIKDIKNINTFDNTRIQGLDFW